REEQVVRLEIAVDDARRVRLVERARGLVEVEHHLALRERLAPLEQAAEILAAEQVHHDERRAGALVHARVERADDVIALDAAGHARLEREARAQPLVLEEVREHHLEGAGAGRLLVEDLVDGAHAALFDATDNPITSLKERPGLENDFTQTWHGDPRR